MKHTAHLLSGLMLTLLAFPAQATITSTTAPATPFEVSIARGGSVTINWQITRTATAGPVTITGLPGEFRIAGNPVATSRTITRRLSNGAQTALTFTETISVPRSAVIEAQRTGATFTYNRSFTDDAGVTVLGDEATLIVGGTTDQLGIAELNLTFEDGEVYRSAGLKEKLHAVAQLSMVGTGNLRAVWEVADESGTTGQPFWRPIRNVSRPIGGNPDITLKSPPLPTETLGRHRVRLRLVEPGENVSDQPVLNYFVTEEGSGELPPFKPKVSAKDGGGLKQ